RHSCPTRRSSDLAPECGAPLDTSQALHLVKVEVAVQLCACLMLTLSGNESPHVMIAHVFTLVFLIIAHAALICRFGSISSLPAMRSAIARSLGGRSGIAFHKRVCKIGRAHV